MHACIDSFIHSQIHTHTHTHTHTTHTQRYMPVNHPPASPGTCISVCVLARASPHGEYNDMTNTQTHTSQKHTLIPAQRDSQNHRNEAEKSCPPAQTTHSLLARSPHPKIPHPRDHLDERPCPPSKGEVGGAAPCNQE